MNAGADVFGALNWGLRRYAWLVLVCVVGLGVVVPLALDRGADTYDSTAQVGPTGKLVLSNLDPLPRIAESIFDNGAVASAIRARLGLPTSATVVPNRVSLTAGQDNVVLTVTGHSADPTRARDLANVAAAAFTIQLNHYNTSVGQFEVQRLATTPAKPVSQLTGGILSIVIGLLAGLVAGVGVVALLLVIRRPVLDEDGARQATGTPVLGNVRLPRRREDSETNGVRGVAPLCRRVVARSSGTVLLVAPARAQAEMRQLGAAMNMIMDRMRQSIPGGLGVSAVNPRLIVSEDPSFEVATLPADALTLLVLPEGIGFKAMHDTATAYLTGGPSGVVMVSRGRSWWRQGDSQHPFGRSHRRRAAKSHPQSQPGSQSGGQPGSQPDPVTEPATSEPRFGFESWQSDDQPPSKIEVPGRGGR